MLKNYLLILGLILSTVSVHSVELDDDFLHLPSLIFIESKEQLNQIPDMTFDGYTYLQEAPQDEVTRFIFIRHGLSTANEERRVAGKWDVELSESGKQQARQIGQLFKDKQIVIHAAYSSPSKRALDTASLVLEHMNNPLYIGLDENLYEKSYGLFDGVGYADEEYAALKEWEKELIADRHTTFREKLLSVVHPEIESRAQIYQRAKHFLDHQWQAHLGQNVLVATHGAFMKVLWMVTLAKQGFELNEFAFSVNNCSLLVLEISAKEARVVALTQGFEKHDPVNPLSDEENLTQLQVQVEQDIHQLLQEPTEEHVSVLIDSLRNCIKAELKYAQSDSDVGFTTMFMLKLHRDLLSVCETQPHDPASIVSYINDMAILG